MAEAARTTGCGILLDINNVYVNAVNFGLDPLEFLRASGPGCLGNPSGWLRSLRKMAHRYPWPGGAPGRLGTVPVGDPPLRSAPDPH